MRKSVFDSKAEERLFKRLKTYWSKYVDVFPQFPPRNVFGFKEIMEMDFNQRAKDYLLRTTFDFLICDPTTHQPLLVIEFDGISGGYSTEAVYYIKENPVNDPYRKLKMETKLKACQQFSVPAIVVSYEECDLLDESENMISILDIIIGDAIEKIEHGKNYNNYVAMLSRAWEDGGEDAADATMMEVEFMSEMDNPVKRKIRDLTKKFPRWGTQTIFPLPDENGYLKGTFRLNSGFKTEGDELLTKQLLSVDISIRQVGIFESDHLSLFNTLGEYCLARKTQKTLGFDGEKWQLAMKQAVWSKH